MGERRTMEFQQDLDQRAEYPAAYFMELLFEGQGNRPSADELDAQIEQRIGKTEFFFDSEELFIFYFQDKMVTYQDGQKYPVGVSMSAFIPFDAGGIGEMEHSQYWNLQDADALLSRCTHKLLLGDWMAAALPGEQRADLLQRWLALALELFPECVAVHIPASGRLMTAKEAKENPFEDRLHFLHSGVSVRFFNVGGRSEYVADTLGLFALGLPDVQCHFHSLEPDDVTELVLNVAAYLFENGDVIQDDETVPGLKADEVWTCQHEMSIIQPARVVVDINPGKYAAGRSEE